MAHISEKMLQAYISRRLPLREEQAIMEHIAMCDSCAHRFAVLMEKRTLMPPPDLKQEILEKIVNRKSSVSVLKELPERKQRQRRELLAYSMRVVFAMAASIMILFTLPAQDNSERMPEEIIQAQGKNVFTFTKDGIVKKKASEKASEEAEGKKEANGEEKRKLTDSLQEATGVFGDALSGFIEQFHR